MRKKQLNEGLNHIDAEIVEGYLKQKDRLNQKRKTRSAWLRFAVIAACFVLIISAVIIPPMLLEDDSSAPPTVPIWDGAKYSAADVAGLFGSINTDSVATNAYTKIYVPDSKYLYLSEFPDEALLGIYQYNDIQKELDEKALKNFIDGFLPHRLARRFHNIRSRSIAISTNPKVAFQSTPNAAITVYPRGKARLKIISPYIKPQAATE